MSKYVMSDIVYKVGAGLYTKEYCEHNGGIQMDINGDLYWNRHSNNMNMEKLKEASYEEIHSGHKVINCNYSQLFWDDSALILCNEMDKRVGEELDLESGTDYDEENDYYYDIYQWYIIDDQTARMLSDHTDEIIYYDRDLDIYVLGVTHCGTSWDYVSDRKSVV